MARILLVDDDCHILSGLRRMLRVYEKDWEIAAAGSVEEALQLLKAGDICAVVADICMPDMDGFALLKAVRSDPRFKLLPVVVLTGSLEEPLHQKVIEFGATNLLLKPCEPEKLIAELRALVP